MSRLPYNNSYGNLVTSGTDVTNSSVATVINFAVAPNWATIVAPDYIPLALHPGDPTKFEIVWVTAFTAGALTGTVTRQAEDSSRWPAVTHAGGTWSCDLTVNDIALLAPVTEPVALTKFTSLARATVVTSTPGAPVAANALIPVDTTTGSVNIPLPVAPADKTLMAIKHVVQGGTNSVTFSCGGSDVFNVTGGVTSKSLPLLNQSALLEYTATGAIWTVISDALTLTSLDLRYLGIATAIPESQVTNLTTDLAAKAAVTEPIALTKVASVTATDATIVVAGTTTAPTIRQAALTGDVTTALNAATLASTANVQAVIRSVTGTTNIPAVGKLMIGGHSYAAEGYTFAPVIGSGSAPGASSPDTAFTSLIRDACGVRKENVTQQMDSLNATANGTTVISALDYPSILESFSYVPLASIGYSASILRTWTLAGGSVSLASGMSNPSVFGTSGLAENPMASFMSGPANLAALPGSESQYISPGTVLSIASTHTGSQTDPGGLMIVRLLGKYWNVAVGGSGLTNSDYPASPTHGGWSTWAKLQPAVIPPSYQMRATAAQATTGAGVSVSVDQIPNVVGGFATTLPVGALVKFSGGATLTLTTAATCQTTAGTLIGTLSAAVNINEIGVISTSVYGNAAPAGQLAMLQTNAAKNGLVVLCWGINDVGFGVDNLYGFKEAKRYVIATATCPYRQYSYRAAPAGQVYTGLPYDNTFSFVNGAGGSAAWSSINGAATITAATMSGTTATITAAGNWVAGQQVTIAGLTNNAGTDWPGANGAVTILTGGAGSFTYTPATTSNTATVATSGGQAGASILALTVPGTYQLGQSVTLSGFGGGTNWSAANGTWLVTTAGVGSCSVTTTATISGTPTLGSVAGYPFGTATVAGATASITPWTSKLQVQSFSLNTGTLSGGTTYADIMVPAWYDGVGAVDLFFAAPVGGASNGGGSATLTYAAAGIAALAPTALFSGANLGYGIKVNNGLAVGVDDIIDTGSCTNLTVSSASSMVLPLSAATITLSSAIPSTVPTKGTWWVKVGGTTWRAFTYNGISSATLQNVASVDPNATGTIVAGNVSDNAPSHQINSGTSQGVGMVKRITGLPAGGGRIRVTVNAVASTTAQFIPDFWGIEASGITQPVVDCTIPYTSFAAAGNGYPQNPVPANVDLFNAVSAAVIAERVAATPNVVAANLNAYMNVSGTTPDPTYFWIDGLHPNDKGYAAIASSVINTVVNSFTNQQLITK